MEKAATKATQHGNPYTWGNEIVCRSRRRSPLWASNVLSRASDYTLKFVLVRRQ